MDKIAKTRSKNKIKGNIPQLYLKPNKKESIEIKPNKIPKKKLKFNESNRRFGNDITNSIKNNAQYVNNHHSFHQKSSSVSNKVNIVGVKQGQILDNNSSLKKIATNGRNNTNKTVEKTFSGDNLYHKKKISESIDNKHQNNNGTSISKLKQSNTNIINKSNIENEKEKDKEKIPSPKNKDKLIRISEYKMEPMLDNNNNKNENNNKNNNNQVQISYYNKKNNFTVFKPNDTSNKIIDFTKSFDENNTEELDKNSMSFPTNCYVCHSPGFLRSCICSIPYFKEIIISCFKCDVCGYKTTDVKGGGGISEKGTKLTLKVEKNEDLNRDVFKSETSKIIIPEIGFESSDGSLGSMYTTIEGIIEKLIENLKNMPFGTGDSKMSNDIDNFIKKLEEIKELKKKFTIIIDDPLSNSFIFPINDVEKDERLIKEEYERTYEQNEEFGINDMKTENYEEK